MQSLFSTFSLVAVMFLGAHASHVTSALAPTASYPVVAYPTSIPQIPSTSQVPMQVAQAPQTTASSTEQSHIPTILSTSQMIAPVSQPRSSTAMYATSMATSTAPGTFVDSSEVYSLTYPAYSRVNPNGVVLVDDVVGIFPVPEGKNPSNIGFIGGKQTKPPQQRKATSIYIYDSASKDRAEISILGDVNGTTLAKESDMLTKGKATTAELGQISGHKATVYTLTAPGGSMRIYRIALGSKGTTDLSLIIFGVITDVPSVSENTVMLDGIVKSIVINETAMQKFLSLNDMAMSKGADASNIAKLSQARTSAEVFYMNKKNAPTYAGFCAQDATIASMKKGTPPASVSCADSATAYAMSVKVSDGYFCLDSTGKTVEHAKSPVTKTICGN